MFAASKSGRSVVAPSSDPNFPYVPLLLETTSTNGQQNNTFLDSSTNNFTITRNGTPTQGSVTPYWPDGQWSNYFDGGANYLSASSSASPSGTEDFCVEFWYFAGIKPSNYPTIFAENTTYNITTSLQIYDRHDAFPTKFSVYGCGINGMASTTTVTQSVWYHVAVTRNLNGGVYTLRLFVNGVLEASQTGASGSLSANACYIGRADTASLAQTYINAYVSNFRIVRGSSVYTAAFTPSTTPLTAITNTSLLTCQSNRFKDNSTNNFTLTTVGTLRVQAFQPFSPVASYTPAAYGGSGYNGTKTDYLSIANTAAVTTYTGDFTLECWVNPTDTSLSASWGIMDTRTSGGTATSWIWNLVNYTSAGWIVQMYAGAAFNFTLRVLPYVWSHVVLQRNGGTLRCFVNGVVDSTALSFTGTLAGGSGAITIANTKDSGLAPYGNIGYISNLRIVNGTAVYSTSGFTPPTAPLTAITNTSLLLNYTNAGIYDAAAQNNATTFGNAQVSTAVTAKWPPTSMRFNGSPDYLLTPIPSLIGAFTIEFWVYRPASGNNWFFTIGDAISGSGSLEVYIGSSGTAFNLWVNNATRITSSTLPTVGAWNYIAVTRDASNEIKFYLNGTQLSPSPTYTSAVAFATTLRLGVEFYNSGLSYGNCYIQDFRITNGVARTITTPTAAFPTR